MDTNEQIVTTESEIKTVKKDLKKIERVLNGPPIKCAVPGCDETGRPKDGLRFIKGKVICARCGHRLLDRGVKSAPYEAILVDDKKKLGRRLEVLEKTDLDAFIEEICPGTNGGETTHHA